MTLDTATSFGHLSNSKFLRKFIFIKRPIFARPLSIRMDLRDCAVIDRHYPRLQQCLEPSKLLNYLENVGVLDEDDVEAIREVKRKTQSRENQVATFVDIIKRREHGFRHLLQALLKSKVQEFLARELLEDDVYNEEGTRIVIIAYKSRSDHFIMM